MHRTSLPLAICLCLLALPPSAAQSAAWPRNWLGQPDNRYVSLRIGVHFYGCVLHDLPDDKGVSPLTKAPAEALAELTGMAADMSVQQAEFERMKAELEENARFYWRNSRFNCAMDFEYLPDFTPQLRSGIAASDAPYYSPVDLPLYGDARKRYDGLLQICVLYSYGKESGKLERVRGGGGFTWGCNDEKRECGWSWWAAPPADHSCGSDWLFCHEFGHQLDSLFYHSGHPEHWFNHLAMLEGNTAGFGEHFDCMAYILRRTKEADWLDLRWGTQREYADADGDHAPDSDAWLVAHGLETDPDPGNVDSDADGLSDRDEMLCGNGNRNGHGERLHEAFAYCDPLNPDSDADGVLDGADEHPYVPLIGAIRQAGPDAPWLEAIEPQPDADPPSPTGNEAARLDAAGAHSDPRDMLFTTQPQVRCELSYQQDRSLHLRILWKNDLDPYAAVYQGGGNPPGSELRLTFDFDNDGWFAGNDNYRLQLDETGVKSVIRNECYSTTEWPTEKTDVVDSSKIPCSVLGNVDGYTHGLDITLPRSLFPELAAKAGEEFGFNLGIRQKPADPKAGNAWFYMIYDPNALLPLELR